MKLLKRKILFCLASEIDFFEARAEFNYHPYIFLYSRLPGFRPSSIRDCALQLVSGGEVDKIVRNQTSLFRLTGKGRDRLFSFFPLSLGQKKVWDHIWRIAIFSTPGLNQETSGLKARKLCQVFKKLGFKKLSRGVYLTPLPISGKLKELLLEKHFSANIAVIESRRLLMLDDQQLAAKIWPLDQIFKDYQELIIKEKSLLRRIRERNSLTYEEKYDFSLILDFYFNLLEKDPGLPKKLLADDWPHETAKKFFIFLTQMIKTKET